MDCLCKSTKEARRRPDIWPNFLVQIQYTSWHWQREINLHVYPINIYVKRCYDRCHVGIKTDLFIVFGVHNFSDIYRDIYVPDGGINISMYF